MVRSVHRGNSPKRQGEYLECEGIDGQYTPQMVIGGTRQCVGSDARKKQKKKNASQARSPAAH